MVGVIKSGRGSKFGKVVGGNFFYKIVGVIESGRGSSKIIGGQIW